MPLIPSLADLNGAGLGRVADDGTTLATAMQLASTKFLEDFTRRH